MAAVLVTSLLSGLLVNFFSPLAAGSGIPQVKVAYWQELGRIDLKTGIVKYLSGIINISGGGTGALGREGPSVFLGSAMASNLSGLFRFERNQRRSPCLVGASSGLAAAFNAPLASITFVIEEILGDLNSCHLGSVILAAVSASFVVHAIIGSQPAFQMARVENVSWNHYLIVPVAVSTCFSGRRHFSRNGCWLFGLNFKTEKNPTLGETSGWRIEYLVAGCRRLLFNWQTWCFQPWLSGSIGGFKMIFRGKQPVF